MSIENIPNIPSDIDPKKVELIGPIENDFEDLSSKDFITKEGSRQAVKLLSQQVLHRAFAKWGMKS